MAPLENQVVNGENKHQKDGVGVDSATQINYQLNNMGSFKENLWRYASAFHETIVWELKSWQKFVREMWPLLLLLIAALGLAIWFAKPAPPKLVLMASGKGGSYLALAQKYVEFFREHVYVADNELRQRAWKIFQKEKNKESKLRKK